MCSISYPHTWYVIQKKDTTFYYTTGGGAAWQSGEVPYGYYENVQQVVDAINKELREKGVPKSVINLSFSEATRKVHVDLSKEQISFFERLSHILGFGGTRVVLSKSTDSPYEADLSTTSTIYTYCDIVQPQIVGGTSAQLLRSIAVDGKPGEIISKTFFKIQYLPVQTLSFEDVQILLRTDTGAPVLFERGNVDNTTF